MACLVGQWTCATARHRRDVSVHAPSNRGASYQSPEQTRSQVQKPTMRSRTENAVTPSETPIPSVKYVFIVEPKVGGGSSYIWCCCCCGRSGGGGAAYFAGGGGGGAGGAGAGGRGGWPLATVRQAVRRAAVVRTDGAACRAATRPCRSRVRLPLASMLQPGLLGFGPLRPHACDFWPVQPGSRLLGTSETTNQSLRPPLATKIGLAPKTRS